MIIYMNMKKQIYNESDNSAGSTSNVSTCQSGGAMREANTVIGVGAGLGAVGLGSTIALGVTCPICYIVAPSLIAAGLWKRRKENKKL